MKSNIFLKCVAAYYIVYSILNIISVTYALFFNPINGLEVLVIILAFTYLFGTIVIGIKSINGKIKAGKILKISILFQLIFFQINGWFFEIQNGAGLNFYIFFRHGVINYGYSLIFLDFELQARITNDQVSYVAANIIPWIFGLIFFSISRWRSRGEG